jgi:hypothetical protein
MLTFYASLPISHALAWEWTSGINTQTTGNLCANIQTGEGKAAYYKLIEFAE